MFFNNFYSTSEHFLPCELSEDCKQHSSHTCALAGYGLSGAWMCVYFNGRVKYLTETSHIQLGGTYKTASSEDFCISNGFGEFCAENWLVMSL